VSAIYIINWTKRVVSHTETFTDDSQYNPWSDEIFAKQIQEHT